MKKLAIGIATIAVAVSALGGTASANNGGTYPPAPVQVTTPTPTIKYGDGLKAKGSGLCPGVPAVFAVQDVNDWTHRYFSGGVQVGPDGTAYYQFSASELSGFYGQITVYVKQFGECTGLATTSVLVKKDAPPKSDPPKQDSSVAAAGEASVPAAAAEPAAAAVVVAALPAAAAVVVPSAVLSSGVTAPAAAASPSGTARPAAVAGDSLPVTGSESSQTLQIALAAFAAGLGLIVVSARRRTASARNH